MGRWRWFGRASSAEVDEEIQSHLRLAVQAHIADGLNPEVARSAALKEFGNVTLTKEATRRVWRGGLAEYSADLWQDLRYACRLLRRSPGYSAVVVAVLALGIGANTAAFSLFKAAFLRPLPGVDAAAELAVIVGRAAAGQTITVSYPDYQYLREHHTAFSGLVASSPAPLSLGLGSRGERVWGELVSGNYFQVLGVTARLGRMLLPSDERTSGSAPVVVITDGLWRRAFGADEDIIGRTVLINAQPLTVVGVAEPGFRGSMLSLVMDVFVPLTMQPQVQPPQDQLASPESQWLIVLGRLKPGIAMSAAAAQTDVLAAQLARMAPVGDVRQRAAVVPFWRSPMGAQLYLLPVVGVLAVTGILLLLIVCTNLASLVLVRGLARQREIAVRLALGAGRRRIVRLLLLENLVLALPAACLGLMLATRLFGLFGGGGGFASVAPTELDTSTDGLVVGFAMGVSCVTACVFGLLPALRSTRVPLVAAMKEGGTAAGPGRARLRGALVIAQVAAALLLLVCAGLTLRTVSAARTADVGFDASGVVSVRLDPSSSGYDETRGRTLYEQLVDNLRVRPGVTAAAVADFVPLRLIEGRSGGVAVDGYTPRDDEDMSVARNLVGPDYFRTLGIALLAGRDFSRLDTPDRPGVVIVNETIARRFWDTPEGAIGKRLRVGDDDDEWRVVVGVAGDLKYLTVSEAATPYFYMPFTQVYRPEMTVHVRGGATDGLLETVRAEVRALDANLPILEASTLEEQARTGVILYETVSAGLVAFALIAIGLAAVGIYGLVAYTVKQRTHEIGIRVALGARRLDVVRRFLERGLALGVIGTGIGLAAAIATTRLMNALLYGVSPTDPLTLAGAVMLVLGAVAAASLGPAWRAARIEPSVALRQQ